MIRASVSRPRSSVPRRKWRLGLRPGTPTPVAFGLWIGSRVAKSAQRITRPIQATESQNAKPSLRRAETSATAAPGSAATAAVAVAAASAAVVTSGDGGMADPRVEHGVEQIDEEVDQHVAHCDDQHGALDHEVVADEDRLDGEAADARQGEDDLDDEGAADQPADLETGDRDEGEAGGPQGVAEQDVPL